MLIYLAVLHHNFKIFTGSTWHRWIFLHPEMLHIYCYHDRHLRSTKLSRPEDGYFVSLNNDVKRSLTILFKSQI